MSSHVGQAALYGGIGTLAGVMAALVGSFRAPGRSLLSYLQHFTAGVVLAAAVVELFPHALRLGPSGAILAGFIAGGLAMGALKAITERVERRDRGDGMGLVVAIAVDLFIDGLVLGASFSAGSTTGLVVAVALSIELFFTSLSNSAAFASDPSPRIADVLRTSAIASLFVLGAVVGALAFAGAGRAVVTVALSFAAAVLIYLAAEELLPEAHEYKDSPTRTLALFAGFTLLLALSLAEG